jgi:tetratricopeptide (TPR) repeat protein
MKPSRSALILLALLLARAPAVHAADTDAPPEYSAMTEARERFQRGVLFYREGNYDAALAEFVRAQELAPNVRSLYTLGQVQAERNDAVGALHFFDQYLLEGGALISPERRGEVERTRRELAEKVSELAIVADAPGAQVFVNDVFVAILPLREPLTINSGKCNLRLERTGYTPVSRELVIASGELREVSLTLAPEVKANAQTQPTLAHDGAPSWDATPFWISLAATASLGSATAAFALATAFTDQPALTEDPGKARDARDRVRTYALLTGGFGAATLVSAGAAAFFLLSRPDPAASDRARVTAKLVPSPSGIYLFGTF